VKTYAMVVMLAAVFALGSAARAQSCYTPVTNWFGTYSLSASGTVSCDPSAICTVNQTISADVGTTSGGATCSEVSWAGADAVTAASIDDQEVVPCNPGSQILTLTGSDGGFSESVLNIDTTSGNYSYSPVSWMNSWSETIQECGGGTNTTTGTDLGIVPISPWPLTFPLSTTTVQALDESDYAFQGTSDQGAVGPWTFSFTLNPIYNDDDDCNQKGGQDQPTDMPEELEGDPFEAVAISSSIGCQNQSLGENVSVVGTGFYLHYESDRAAGAPSDHVATKDAAMLGGWTLSVHHAYDPNTNTLFLGDGRQRNGYQLGAPVSYNGDLLVTLEDGSQVYVFTSAGQHLQTLRPLTGAVEYSFGYDTAGNLTTVTDATGNVTTIQRNASEQATAIVSPYGQTTTLSVDSNGFLNQVTDPLGDSETLVNGSTGLLASRTDHNGNVFNYTYDGNGRLSKDADSLGGYVALSRTNATSGLGWTVGEVTSMGRTTSYQPTLTLPWVQDGTQPQSEQKTVIWPDGLQATSSNSLASGNLSRGFTLPDGTSDSETQGPDPVWGLQVPIGTSETLTQGNLTMNITGSRVTTLGTAGNPFSVSTETDTKVINGRSYTSTFTGSNRTWVNTSPVGRTVTIGLDSLERIASTQVEGLTATDLKYDSRGRLASATQGTRNTTFAYDSDGFLAIVTDPLKLTTSFGYDADGNLLTTTLPDGRIITYTYDANGNLTSVTPPGESAHDFAYNAVNMPTDYTPPTVAGTGPTTYAYNLDRDPTTITRPDGKTIEFEYDSAGRLVAVETPTGNTKYTYNMTTGNVASANRGVQDLSYGYNGPLPTKSTWSGTVAGSVSRVYNDNFWVSSENVSGGSDVALAYDHDGLLTEAGTFTIKRNAKNGLITGTTLGVATDSRTYDSFGELIGYTASSNGAVVYSVTYTRDADGRVTAKTETINGTTNTDSYTYDLAGRLISVTKNGATDTYTYDTNSNRLTGTTSSGTATGTYDAQDRLLTYGNASFTYTANGELASQKVGSQNTTYSYDVLGNMIASTLPNGSKLTYIIDGENHRVGKEASSALETGFLYDADRIVAQLNGSSGLVSQFVYATGSNSPDYMINGGVTYRIFSDQLGSPVLVVNTATGAIAEQITYDEFGNVLTDSSPGFQPFGFAGGLYDQDTKLVRFDARDYNPLIGRWTAKDPIQFNGGDTNLYGYVLNDPVNRFDPSGLQGQACTCTSSAATPTPTPQVSSPADSPGWVSFVSGAAYTSTLGMIAAMTRANGADAARSFMNEMSLVDQGAGTAGLEAGGDLTAEAVGLAGVGETLALTASAAAGWVTGSLIDQGLTAANGGQSFGDELYGIHQEASRFFDELGKYLKRHKCGL
jgi:RHS repeat-associated protein